MCDTFLKYGLPLIVMPPPGVFYPALFATDPVSVDRLAYIMYRWGFFNPVLQSAVNLSGCTYCFWFIFIARLAQLPRHFEQLKSYVHQKLQNVFFLMLMVMASLFLVVIYCVTALVYI